MGEWDRARLAYRQLLGDADPAAAVVADDGIVDLRPGGAWSSEAGGRLRVASGPGDLAQLRSLVESITGTGTWPSAPGAAGTVLQSRIQPVPLASVARLVAAMDGLVTDNGGMWRTWRTTTELIVARLDDLDGLDVEAIVVSA